MKENGNNQNIDNLIDEKMQEAFGLDDDSLVAEFDRAADEADDSELIAPKGEFEKIIAGVDESRTKKKVIRLKRVAKVGLLVAALGCMLLGTGIGASGKKWYEYRIFKTDGNNHVWDNTKNLASVNDLNDAYMQIEDEVGIKALRLIYMPKGMKLNDLFFEEGYARLRFTCNNNSIDFVQSHEDVENSGSTMSDCKTEYDDCNSEFSVYNDRLKQKLPVYKNVLPNGDIELSTELAVDNAYYHIAGIMDEDEFVKILKRISL